MKTRNTVQPMVLDWLMAVDCHYTDNERRVLTVLRNHPTLSSAAIELGLSPTRVGKIALTALRRPRNVVDKLNQELKRRVPDPAIERHRIDHKTETLKIRRLLAQFRPFVPVYWEDVAFGLSGLSNRRGVGETSVRTLHGRMVEVLGHDWWVLPEGRGRF